MNTDNMLRFALICGSASTALAQLGTGTVTWEANDGSGWTSNRLETTAPSVEVRMKAAWSADVDFGFGLAGIQFDAVVTSPTEASDTVTDARRLPRFDQGSFQILTASRFGNQTKIDDSRDTFPPGLGTRGIFPGQLAPNFGWNDRSNPALVFSFRLTFDTTPGTRTINSLYVPPTNGDSVSRYMRIYTNGNGAQNFPNTTTLPLDIIFIPAPGPAALAAASALLLTRRRR
jgi:hypothetical protein